MKPTTLLALALLGCGSPSYAVQFGGRQLGAEQLSLAQKAGNDWCKATSGECCSTVRAESDTQPLRMVDVIRERDGSVRPAGRGMTLSYADESRIDVQLLSGMPDDTFSKVVRHEFGHACKIYLQPGAEELGELPPGNVMALYVEDQPETITASDVEYTRRK